MVDAVERQRVEALGPAERLIETLTTYTDHCVHNRPGVVQPDPTNPVGARWTPATWVVDADDASRKTVHLLVGKGRRGTAIGALSDDGAVAGALNTRFQPPGLFAEAVAWVYRQCAEIWRMDNEFAARFASWAFPREHRDLKVVLAALMLVQTRSGTPVVDESGKAEFFDDDFRSVGEAMCLTAGAHDIDAKLLLRIGDVLRLPAVADINRDLGFGCSLREPPMGRWPKTVRKWLLYRERNPRALDGLVRSGQRRMVAELARRVGYKPETLAFFAALRWKQKQAADGRRQMAIGVEVAKAESWAGLTEREICQRIVKQRVGWKRAMGLLPPDVGLTQAIVAAAIEVDAVSDTDLIIMTPRLEELGILAVPPIRARWQQALDRVEHQRAAHIKTRVRSAAIAERLDAAAEKAAAKAVAEVTKQFRVYVFVDTSASMAGSIETAKRILPALLSAFSVDRLHVATFNTAGAEVKLKSATANAIKAAFAGKQAGGGTCHHEGVRALAHHKPAPDEEALFIFIGDQGERRSDYLIAAIREFGAPVSAVLLLWLPGDPGRAVEDAAEALEVPCRRVDETVFADAYALPRVLRSLIAAAPVARAPEGPRRTARKTLVEEILATPLLQKPAWAV